MSATFNENDTHTKSQFERYSIYEKVDVFIIYSDKCYFDTVAI